MFQRVFILLSGIVILIIFAFVIFTFIVPEDSPMPGLSIVNSEIVTESSSTTEQQLPLSQFVELSYGDLVYVPEGANHYLIQTQTVASDLRPFTDKTLALLLSAMSGFGTKDSDFTNSGVVFDRMSGDFVLTFVDKEIGTSSIATIYKRTDSGNFEDDLKRISVGKKFSFETDEEFQTRRGMVEKYCHAVENKLTLTERYNLLPTNIFSELSDDEQMEYGPFPCGTGMYYIFDTFIVRVPFTGDAGIVGVDDIKIK